MVPDRDLPTRLATSPVPWLSTGKGTGGDLDVGLAAAVEVFRNLSTLPFPRTASRRQREAVCEQVRNLLRRCPVMPGDFLTGLEKPSRSSSLLVERWLSASETFLQGSDRALWLARDQRLTILLNHQEHLRLRAIAGGFDCGCLSHLLERADNLLKSELPIAFKPGIGYLASLPGRCGSGLQFSLLLHLPGLVMARQIDPVLRAARQLGIKVTGGFGQGRRINGHYFDFTWQAQGDCRPLESWARVKAMANQLVRGERMARRQLWSRRRGWLYDQIGRAYGILRYGASLSESELFGWMSLLRLGSVLGLFSNLRPGELDGCLVRLQKTHLLVAAGEAAGVESGLAGRRSQKIRDWLKAKEPNQLGSSQII